MKKNKAEWKEINGEKWFKFDNGLNELKHMYGNLIGMAILILFIIFVTLFYFKIFNHLEAFQEDPLIFGAARLEDYYDESVSCSCYTDSHSYSWNATSFIKPDIGILSNPYIGMNIPEDIWDT